MVKTGWDKASRGSVAELIQSKTALWTKPKKETLQVFFSLSVVLIHSPVEVLLSERKKKKEKAQEDLEPS